MSWHCRYVSVMGNHIINPVITPSGASGTVTGILAASLVGPDYHLFPVWTPVNMQLGEWGDPPILFEFYAQTKPFSISSECL